MSDGSESGSGSGGRPPRAILLQSSGALAAAGVLVLCGESARLFEQHVEIQRVSWFCGENADWLPFLPWLLLAPLFWIGWRGSANAAASSRDVSGQAVHCGRSRVPMNLTRHVLRIGGGVLVAACAFLASRYVGQQFGTLPPAYHDEYSYLFQAETFRAGRVSFPGFEPMPELFDQVHVLNEGRFASRYFPGTGLWIAVVGRMAGPYFGHWVAGMLVAWSVYQIGCELSGVGVGLLAGVLTAASPGLALFSNLLLAHHPTLVGLMVFIWQFCVMLRTGGWSNGLAAGIALAYAMLCRPMTAFGVALPFGAYFGWWLLTGLPRFGEDDEDPTTHAQQRAAVRQRVWLSLSLAAPLAAGLSACCWYNREITGDALLTPYQLYTNVYTPRHDYGFNNVIRGEQHLGPKVLDNYDRWAENLTPALAMRNVQRRLAASLRWTLGIVPLAMGAMALLLLRAGPRGTVDCTRTSITGWRLIGCAIVSLHAVHVPYWFEGIMGWHYVFESAPLWLLLFADATRRQISAWCDAGRPAMSIWWGGVIVIAVAVNWFTVIPLWPGRLPVGVAEIAFPRQKYGRFKSEAAWITRGRKSVVFVNADPADRHIDFVANSPALDDTILFARDRPGRTDLDAARRLFPDREAFLYDAASGRWQRVP